MLAPYNVYACTIEFYILDAMEALAKPRLLEFRHSHNKWYRDFCNHKSEYHRAFGRALYDYLVKICYGEMRHGADHCRYRIPKFKGAGESRAAAYAIAIQYNPGSILSRAQELFSKPWRAPSYGGKSWARIARCAARYGTVPDRVFIDSVVDLAHNGGICFDKVEAGVFHTGDPIYNLNSYKDFLDYKAHTQPAYLIVEHLDYTRSRIRLLYHRAVSLGLLSVPPRWSGELVPGETGAYYWLGEDILRYQCISWGTEEVDEPIVNTFDDDDDDDDDDDTECTYCSKWIDSDEAHWTVDGWVCDTCLDAHYTVCSVCEKAVPDEGTTIVQGKSVCSACIDSYCATCASCGAVHPTESADMIRIVGEWYCGDCWGTCEECGNTLPNTDLYTLEEGGDLYCEDCMAEKEKEKEKEKQEEEVC